MSRIGVATPWDDCPYAKSNANTFVCARAYRVFLTSCVGINLGTSLGACGNLRMSPRLVPPHSVGKPYTNSPPSSIVTLFHIFLRHSIGRSDGYLSLFHVFRRHSTERSVGYLPVFVTVGCGDQKTRNNGNMLSFAQQNFKYSLQT